MQDMCAIIGKRLSSRDSAKEVDETRISSRGGADPFLIVDTDQALANVDVWAVMFDGSDAHIQAEWGMLCLLRIHMISLSSFRIGMLPDARPAVNGLQSRRRN